MSFLRNLKMQLSLVLGKANWLDVHEFISIEMIRDGGSFALKFQGRDGNRYILFTRIQFADVGPEREDERGYSQERETVGYGKPIIIDCDPAKRPQDTTGRIYGGLNGPSARISWGKARQILRRAGPLARGLGSIHADWLKLMTAIVEGAAIRRQAGPRDRHGIDLEFNRHGADGRQR